MEKLSIDQIREIKAAQEEDVRRKVREGRFDELRAEAEANLGVWRKLWNEGLWLPEGRPDPRLPLPRRKDRED